MIKSIKEKTWVSPTEKFVQSINNIVETGISKEDKEFLIAELEEMIKRLKKGQEEFKSHH